MDTRISLSDAWEILAGYDTAVWCGLLVAVITFVIEVILCSKGIIFSKEEKLIAAAKKKGNMITAKMTDCRYEDRTPYDKRTNRMYIAMYEYVIGGISRKKQIISTSGKPPRTITLYYGSNPKKTISEYDVIRPSFKFLIYIIPILVAFLTMKIMGFSV